ncbi:uncharacterized protein LOC117338870 [Pecten maximus]|uniref:uncharacterized protein LOC117338870 n=1 Tax=Pecten maximus TaxID=6579 RepID=UPI001457EED3|nr:uncharacterized protein LOC117338870 [Pecten maximus]
MKFNLSGIMYCDICRKNRNLADQSSSMFIGTSSFRRDTLVSHWKSSSHQRCEERKKPQESSSSSSLAASGPIVDMARKMGEDVEKQIEKLINTAYFVCKEEMPFQSYPSLINLQLKNKADMGNFYRTDNAYRRFVSPIFDELYGAYTEELKTNKFFSIMIDGATDCSVTENELIYVRSLGDNGTPENHYLSMEDIQHAHADGIVECIEKAFSRCGMDDWRDKLIGFGSDGASVNLGGRAGVAVLELAATNAIKQHRLMRDVQDLLTNVYKQYHYSPKALRELRQIAESLEEKVLKPGNLHGTRWLPHVHGALKIVVRDYMVIVAHFEHIITTRSASAEVQGRAANVSKKLKDYSFLYMVFFMLDVLSVLSELSLASQKDSVTLGQMIDAVTSTHLSLVELKSENGNTLSNFLQDVTDENCFKTIQLTNVKDNDDFKPQKEDIIGKVSQALEQRFRSMETDPILTAAATLMGRISKGQG